MIEWIHIWHFQNITDKKVKLSPYVNTFFGPTGAGKSAFLRALRWLLLNRPLGKSFVGNWRKAKYVKVTARIDKTTASHVRRNGNAIYRLGRHRYKAFGAGLPSRCADLFNVSEINFQNQIEAPLWFTLPPIEVSRRLNSIINLKAIDKALQIAASKVREAKASVVVSGARLKEAKAARRSHRGAVRLRRKVQQLQSIRSKRSLDRLACSRIDSLLRGTRASMKRHKIVSNGVKWLLVAIRTGKRYRATVQQADRLGALVAQLDRSRVLARSEAPSIAPLTKRFKAALAAETAASRLHGLWLAATNTAWTVNDLQKQIEEAQFQLKKFKGRCPVCKRKFPKK